MSISTRALAGVCIAALLTGCSTVGPDFVAPNAPSASTYAMRGDTSPTLATAPMIDGRGWWTDLGSPELNTIMAQALAANPTLAEADATLSRSQSELRRITALAAPQVEGTAGIEKKRTNLASFGLDVGSGEAPFAIGSPISTLYSIGTSVSFDLDVFGGARRGREAALARLQEQGWRRDAAALALTGNVALAALRIATYRSELDAALAIVESDRQLIDIARSAEAAGGATPADISTSQAQLAADSAQIPPIEAQLAQARHALALLVGRAPAEWEPPSLRLATFTLPDKIPESLPSQLVQRRPDILAAEANLHAATADIGVETAKLYPDVKVSAGYSHGALSPSEIFSRDTSGWNFGPQLNLPLFDGGRRRAGRDVALAAARAADARYRGAVLSAFGQVADALDALGHDDALLQALQEQQRTAENGEADARKAYELGGSPLVRVVDAKRQADRARRQTVRAEGDRYAHLIALFTATAAPWR